MLKTKLESDDRVELSLSGARISLNAEQLEQQLQALSELREQLAEKIPEQQQQIQRVSVNPLYNVRLDKESKTCLLSIRHPGFGWINFELPTQEVLNMRTMWNHIVDKLDIEPPAGYYEGPDRRRSQPH